jgi:acyl dehydratase
MLDRSCIGHVFPDRTVEVEAGQLRFFAKAMGETDPIYFDADAARAAGHPALPAPPTFLFSLDLQSNENADALALLNIDIGTVLHGEQQFEHRAQIHAGDRITLSSRIVDLYDKKGGALEFLVQETTAVNQHGVPVGSSRSVTVIRNA